ncbi:S10 family peptidase [Simiduia aestuariiviva]|uniref:Carboxypeptidase C (Cathepsin A) n=1 Tax=Simiduia aestuariiviva TaxID=1510459 RepID=A0A839UX67_9GAMM|nr:peptidase S10 [Simiduia aestuariiviva]MBB3169957.1 carboxypeptidase C (cathepsin A) [Simiduia aestuariiviva]
MRNILLIAFLLLTTPLALAEKDDAPVDPFPEEIQKVTEHKVSIAGKTISYTATAGISFVYNDKHEKIGSVYYTAYVKNGEKAGKRPVTFAYNGGPGSASVWLHMGTLGPKRVVFDDEGFPTPPPYKVVDNEFSILDKTDLVFIDPVGTGYSRVGGKGSAEDFHGVWEDVKSVSEFIRLYTTRNGRWSSPKYLVGESYGTLRSAGIAHHMSEKMGMYFNGVMLISSVLNFAIENDPDDPTQIMSPISLLPAYTATAWYHKKLSTPLQADLQATLKQAREFALGEYASVLLQGDWATQAQVDSATKKLAALTGLPEALVREQNMRINLKEFVHNLLRDEGKTVGRLDSRFVTEELDAMNQPGYRDPSYMAIHGPYTAAVMDYLHSDLKFTSDLPYHILGGGVKSWNYEDFAEDMFDMSRKLRHAMLRNPDMRVFVANGYYDLATPFFATEFNFSHMGLPAALKNNVTMAYYESGHMMYIRKHDLKKLKADLANFIQ